MNYPELTAWATVGLGLGTFLLGAVAVRQAKLTGDALGAAKRDTEEAIKARTDQRAPLVTIHAISGGDPAGAWLKALPPPEEKRFMHPADADVEMSVTGWFEITNQGQSTALVDAPERSTLLRVTHGVAPLSEVDPSPPHLDRWQFPLRPAETFIFFVESRRSLDQWRALMSDQGVPRTSVSVFVEDTFEDGILDSTTLWFSGSPVEEDGGGGFRASPTPPALVVGRTVRKYRFEQQVTAT